MCRWVAPLMSWRHKANADYPEGERREMHRIITEGTVPV
jgi:hypothetical protein